MGKFTHTAIVPYAIPEPKNRSNEHSHPRETPNPNPNPEKGTKLQKRTKSLDQINKSQD